MDGSVRSCGLGRFYRRILDHGATAALGQHGGNTALVCILPWPLRLGRIRRIPLSLDIGTGHAALNGIPVAQSVQA